MRRLGDQGARIEVLAADVSRQEDIGQILARMRQELPPLKGVFHLAATLEDGALLQQTWDRFHKVLSPQS